MMKSFATRFFSAVFAIIAVYGLWHFLGTHGFKILCTLAVLLGGLELMRLLFREDDHRLHRGAFYFFILCIFALSSLHPSQAAIVFAFFSICFCLLSLLSQKKFLNLEALTSFQARSVLGFFYVGLLPSFAVQIVDLPQGTTWFLTLLAVVFAGDIGAYLTGMLIGRRKLMPLISPQKTVEGAAGGLTCSVAVGMYCAHVLGHPMFYLAILSAGTAIIAQFGDLFESQLKRAADIKDSGRIMPGHGGILDRIDGVLFASPVILFGAVLLEGQFN